MNKEFFDSMQEQMKPAPEVRAALSERLAQPVKRRMSVRKYAAVAACAALVLALCGAAVVSEWDTFVARYMREHPNATYYESSNGSGIIVESFRPDIEEHPLHSYILIEDSSVYHVTEQGMTHWFFEWIDSEIAVDSGAGTALSAPNTDDLPSSPLDAPVQEEALRARHKLDIYTRPHPDWYGGSYIDDTGTLVICLVESEDLGHKSLELQILDWTDNGKVAFTSGKYSLAYLLDLQTKVCDAMLERGLLSVCSTDEVHNRLDLTLSSVTDEALAFLAELDPDDDAIYVQVGRISTGPDLSTEDPAVYHATPGGTTVPIVPEDDEGLTAIEPYYDGAHYDVEHLPEELPEKKQPAITVQSASEDASTASRDLNP